MSNRKITDMAAMAAGGQATGDVLPIIDISETAAVDKNKKITVESLFKGIPSNVGIGTTSAQANLDIAPASSSASLRVHARSNSTPEPTIELVRGANTTFGADNYRDYRLKSSAGELIVEYGHAGVTSEALRFDAGNVGIGTSNPLTRIHLAETGASDEPTLLIESENSKIYLRTAGSSGSFPTGGGPNDGELVYVGGDFRVGAQAAGKSLMFVSGGYDERMRIDSTGCVGINVTPSGDSKLQVNGSMRFAGSGTASDSTSPIMYRASGADNLAFASGNSERMRLDSGGKLLVGTSQSKVAGGVTAGIQVGGTSAQSSIRLTRDSADTGGPFLALSKSRGSTVGSNTVVQAGDTLGTVRFAGADGTDHASIAAEIRCFVDTTPGSNNIPGRLTFSTTPDGSTSTEERMRIDSLGRLLINTTTAFATSTADFRQRTGTSSTQSPAIGLMRNDTAVLNTNHLGALEFYSNDGGTPVNCALIKAEATQTHSASARGTAIRFSVTQDGTNTPFEAMELDDDGRLRTFGASSVTAQFRTISTNAASTAIGLVKGASAVSTGGTTCFVVRCDGDVENTNNSYGAISDVKLKENIVDAGSQWADLKALRVRKFNFKEETGNGTDTHIGLIAQEVELVSPGLVKDTTDIEEYQDPVLDSEGNPVLDDDGNPIVDTKERETGEVTKTVGYSVLYMKAVKALQEAMERIETLETKVAALEAG